MPLAEKFMNEDYKLKKQMEIIVESGRSTVFH